MDKLTKKLEYLSWLKEIGIGYYFSDKKESNILQTKPLEDKHNKPNKINNKAMISKQPISTNNKNIAYLNNINSIEELKEIVNNFDGCELKNFATNTVFSDGAHDAKIMLIGEAPGAKEDEQGVPFCGESGKLLDLALEAIGLSREKNIYITNTVFWRPPANRKPTKQELELCRPFLEKHIALLAPKLIICVGSTAAANILGDKITINAARNKTYLYNNEYLAQPIKTMSIFHPAYLLRQPGKKKDTWFDLLKIKNFLATNQ